MKERPIIMQAESVRAILDGRKTQTRRVAKYNPFLGEPSEWGQRAKDQESEFVRITGDYRRFCPHGHPGDRLWVKEAFAWFKDGEFSRYIHKASVPSGLWGECKWQSPLFMPWRASRITIELVNVRVERVQQISRADVLAEGFDKIENETWPWRQYMKLWESIHGQGSWATNPWVWVLEFKRLDA